MIPKVPKAVKGMKDIFSLNLKKHNFILKKAENIFKKYSYESILLNILEHKEVFKRTLGESSEIITKEMYYLKDLSNNTLVLRPEGTAGLIRFILENNLQYNLPLKFYYNGAMFRYEKPQKGRMRQFFQLGIEFLGSKDIFSDVEVIVIAFELLKSIFNEDKHKFIIEINTIGSIEERNEYNKILMNYYKDKNIYNKLSELSKIRLEKNNPLRIFDSKEQQDIEIYNNAPPIFTVFNEETKAKYNKLILILKKFNIPLIENRFLVRGLDYYNDTCFEIKPENQNLSQSSLLGGGRYDQLGNLLSGKLIQNESLIPAIGFAAGIDRIANLLNDENFKEDKINIKIGLVFVNKNCPDEKEMEVKLKFIEFINEINDENYCFEIIYGNRKIDKQFEYLDKNKFNFAIIIGLEELNNKCVKIKNLKTRKIEICEFNKLREIIKRLK